MNRYVTTNVNHVGFKNRSVARFTWIFSPILKSYLITYVSKKGAVNRRSLLLSLFVLFISASIVSCGSNNSSGETPLVAKECNAVNTVDIEDFPHIISKQGEIYSEDEVYCYRFILTEESRIDISIGGDNSEWMLYYDDAAIEVNRSMGTNDITRITRILAKGTYYIQIKRRDTSNDFGFYSLSINKESLYYACRHNTIFPTTFIPYTSSRLRLENRGDFNCFRFTLSTGRNVTISTASSIDTAGRLYTSNGSLIESNDNDGSGNNFLIRRTISAGTYYLIVTSVTNAVGPYSLNVTHDSPPSPSSPSSPLPSSCQSGSYTSISSILYTSSSSSLSPAGDRNCFSFTLSTRRTVNISTTGSTDTLGRLYTSTGTLLETDSNDGSGSNFEISRDLSAGIYYVEVASENSSSGSYTLRVTQPFPDPACSLTSISSIPYTTTSHNLSPAGDRDCFRFTLSTSRNITMSTASSIDTVGRLYTSSGSLIESDDDDGSGTNFLIRGTLSAGTYYVEVSGFSDIDTGPYTLNVAYTTSPPSPEGGLVANKQQCSSSNSISISIPYTSPNSQLTNLDDRDCFRFTLSTRRTVTMSTAGSTDTLGRLYNSGGSLIEENNDGSIDNNFEISRDLSAGTYYVEVSGYQDSATGPYTLNVAYSLPSSCQSGSYTSISSIPYATTSHNLSPAGDRDCFSFTLSTSRNITMSTASSIDTVGSLYASNGSLIESNDDGGSDSNFLIRGTLSAGTYYVEVSGFSSSTTGPYTLNVADPTSLPLSCQSGNFASISSIPYTSVGFSLSPAGNRDCFRFTLSAGRTVTMSTTGSTDTLGRLYTSTGTLLETDSNDGSGSNFEISRSLSAGTYYVEVASQNSRSGSYTLRVALTFPGHACSLTSISSIPYTTTSHNLSHAGDRDCFIFTLSTSRNITMSTASSIDTVGRLYTSSGSLIESDDDDGSATNFLIRRTLSAGIYYLEVLGFSDSITGPYTLNVTYSTGTLTGSLSHVTSVPDTSSLNLDGAHSVTTAVVGGTTYLFVSGTVDGGVSVFRVSSAGSLTNVDNVRGISGARGLDTAVIGGSTYLYVTAGGTGGVAVYRVNSGGTLTSIGNNIISHLGGSADDLITVRVGSNTYGYVTSRDNDRLAGILLSSSFSFRVLTQQLLSDTDSSLYELNGAIGLATAVVGSNTYLYVTGRDDHGITVFRIPSVSTQSLTYIAAYSDTFDIELNGADSVTSAYIGGTPYLFVTGFIDDGVSIFRINNDGTLFHVSRITDTSSAALNAASAVTTAVLSGNTYLFVGGYFGAGISGFRISGGGGATHINTVSDTSLNELNGVSDITTAVVGGNLYLFAAGEEDDGVSVFWVSP